MFDLDFQGHAIKTLGFKAIRWSHMIHSNMFEILDFENVGIDTKIKILSCLQPEIRKVTQNDV